MKVFYIKASRSGIEVIKRHITSRALENPVLSLEITFCAIFGRSHHKEQFFEIILNLNQWFRRKFHSRTFLI